MLPLRFPGVWLSLGWLMVIGFCALLLAPPPEVPMNLGWDKLNHAIGFALLMLWFCGIYAKSRYLAIAAALILFGIALEFAQRAIGYRSFEVADMAANGAGVVIGWIVALMVAGGWCLRVERLVSSSNSSST